MCHLFWEDVLLLFNKFDKVCIKRTKLLTSLPFLLRCWESKVLPQFLHIRRHIHSQAVNRIYRHTSLNLIRERIHHNRHELDIVSCNLLETHLHLSKIFSTTTWSLVDRIHY